MLTHVEISNYRGFRSFKMDGLAQVNLFVGKNNSGKTAVLEALQFLTSGGEMLTLAQAAERRGEVIFSRQDRAVRFEVSHFFHGHLLSVDSTFSIKGDNGYLPVTVKIVAISEGGSGKPKGDQPQPRTAPGFAIKIERSGEQARLARLGRDGGVSLEDAPYLFDPYNQRVVLQRGEQSSARFISVDSLDGATLGTMWDEVVLSKKESEVSEALKVLEPSLESIQMLTGMLPHAQVGSRTGAVVGLIGQRGRVPLGSMGDGMRRMLALSTSLVCAKAGSLFVDEIDTGLHYSVMADMWKLVIAKAVSSNVQVFATTHSWDCIEGLSLLCEREPGFVDSVAIHKIDRGLPHSVAFNGKSLVRMKKADIDPR